MAHHASNVNERVILNRALIRVLLYFEAYRRQAKRASDPPVAIRNQYDASRVEGEAETGSAAAITAAAQAPARKSAAKR
jgi:hypothetical protein